MGLPRRSQPSEMGPNSSNRCELDGDGATASSEGENMWGVVEPLSFKCSRTKVATCS